MTRPTPGRRARAGARERRYHHGDLRAALLEAALAVINEVGPSALSIREVARRAGVSHAAPYRHFRNRDALIEGVVEQGFALMQQAMLRRMAAAPPDPTQQFAASGLAYVEFALEHPSHYRVLFGGNLLSREASQHRASDDVLAALIDALRQCQALGVVRAGDPVHQALAIWSLIHGFVSLLIDHRIDHLLGKGQSLESIRDGVLALIFQGIAVPATRTTPASDGAARTGPRRSRAEGTTGTRCNFP
jgi:AcrR family transcriptional regulator